MAIKYSQKVIQHFTSPQNVGDLKDANAFSTEGSPACGDMITYSLRINPETNIIEDIKFRSFGCASNIATGSVATMLAKGKTVDDIKSLKHSDLTHALDGLPAVKLHCSILAIDGLKAAVHKWEIDQGRAQEVQLKLDKRSVYEILEKVVNPQTGKSINEGHQIKRINVDAAEGRVFIELKLNDEEEKFAPNIEEEIREKIEEIPGARIILVQFSTF